MVRERDLAGARLRAAADERGVGDGVVRRAERPDRESGPAPGGEQPGDRVDRRDLDRGVDVELGQQAGQPARQHRLAAARRPAEQQVVAARGGDLRARAGPSAGRRRRRDRDRRRGRRRRRRRPASTVGAGRSDRGAPSTTWWSASTATIVVSGTIAASAALAVGRMHAAQAGRAAPRPSPAARRASAGCRRRATARRRPGSRRGCARARRRPARQHAERDRQVEAGADLAHVGRREVHRDARARVVEARVADRGAHAIARSRARWRRAGRPA